MKHSFKIFKWKLKGSPLPPPHAIKIRTINSLQKKHGAKTFIETGTFLGDMVEAQCKNFEKLHSIELSEELFQRAKDRFSGISKITLHQGDSGKVLKDIVDGIDHQALFWLDGHYSGGFTALGDSECPVLEELAAIFAGKTNDHVILIDDARCFNGEGDYPSVEEVTKIIKGHNSQYNITIKDDVIIADPG